MLLERLEEDSLIKTVRCPYCKEQTEYLIYHLKNICDKLVIKKEPIKQISEEESELILKAFLSLYSKSEIKREPNWKEIKESKFYKMNKNERVR